MADAEKKKLFEELGESRRQMRRDQIAESVKDPSEAYDGIDIRGIPEDDIKNDWKHLIDIAKVKFPEHLALKFKLKPIQRVAAIAYILGWPTENIAIAANLTQRTIQRWLSHELTQEFIKAVQYHEGSRDNRELVDKELYNSILVIKEIRDDPTIKAETRLSAAKWFYEQKFGKAKESREITGINLKDLTEQLMKASQDEKLAAQVIDDCNKPDLTH